MFVPRSLVAAVLFCMGVVLADNALPGGVFKVDTRSKDVVQVALFATQRFNLYYSREPTIFKALRVASAEKQVVAGTKYTLQVLLGLTQCGKNVPSWLLRFCHLQDPEKLLLCKFVVVDVPWKHGMDLTSVSCHLFRRW